MRSVNNKNIRLKPTVGVMAAIVKSIILPLIVLSVSNNRRTEAQCPWTRESAELHSDCICDFNPSSTTNLEHLPPINRMSVQCAPVNFSTLLQALKQTASIELPQELLWNDNDDEQANDSAANKSSTGLDANEEHTAAVARFVSQSKIDLLHLSNSSIGQLEQNTFVLDLAKLQRSDGSNVQLGLTVRPGDNNNDIHHQESSGGGGGGGGGDERRLLVVAMQSLHLSRCQIDKIHARAFAGLEWSLTSLSLSDNLLESVPSAALKSLVQLRVLDLSNNKLVQVDANAFSSLNKLNTLRLADNRLSDSSSSSNQRQQTAAAAAAATGNIMDSTTQFKSNTNQSSTVQMLANGGQSQTTSAGIDRRAFVGLENCLSDLNLKNTQLAELPEAAKHLRKLAFLNLAQNRISFLAPRSFEQSSNSLTAINLERNRIAQLHEDTFAGVERSLSSLSLLGNLLSEFPVRQLAKLNALRRLDIGFNEIEQIPADAFVAHPRLMLIALDGNPIESLPETTFRPLEGILKGMSVGGKSLHCDCRLSWMLRWQREHNLQISSREREPQFCAKPHYLRSLVSFAALKPEHLTCDSWPTTTTLSLSSASTWGGNYNFSTLAARQTTRPAELVTTVFVARALPSIPPTTTPRAIPTTTTTPESRQSSTDQVQTTTVYPDSAEPGTTSGDESAAGTEFEAAEATTSLATISNLLRFGDRQNGGPAGSERPNIPEEDSAAAPQERRPIRKTNRQGYQANRETIATDLMRQKAPTTPKIGSEVQVAATTTVVAPNSNSNSRPKGHSSGFAVFGARSNTNAAASDNQASQKESRRAVGQVAQSNASISGLVPAIPTTVNVYKQLLNTASSTIQSSQSAQQQVFHKGSRFVDDTVAPSTGFKLANFGEADLEIGRNSAHSEPARRQPNTPIIAITTTTSPITIQSPEPANAESKFEILTSSTSFANNDQLDANFADLIAREQPAPTTTTSRPFANNTRMSVSSMYRLSTTPRQFASLATAAAAAETNTPLTTTTRVDFSAPNTSKPTIVAGSRLATSSTTTTTTTTSAPAPQIRSATTTSTSRAPNTEIQTSESRVVSTTRMAATVRFVDSSGQPTSVGQKRESSSTTSTSIPNVSTSEPTYASGPLITRQASDLSMSPRPKVDPKPTRQQQQQQQQKIVALDQPVATKPIEIRQQPSTTTATTTGEAPTSEPTTRSNEDTKPYRSSQPPNLKEVAASHGPVPGATATTTTMRTQKSSSHPISGHFEANLVTKDNFDFVPRQARDEAEGQSFRQLDGAARLFSRLFRLIDVDQLALILAGLLCVVTFLLALTTICVCCCNRKTSSRDGAHLQSDSSLVATLSRQSSRTRRGPSLCDRIFCCFNRNRIVTPMTSLILHDDDNSSGGRSSSSAGLKSNGKSMLLSGQQLFCADRQSSLFRSIRGASLRLARDRAQSQQPTRLVSTMGKKLKLNTATSDRKRAKAATEWQQSNQTSHPRHQHLAPQDRWRVCVLPDDATSSCDSDKSCSPGANRNNRYNISEAHQAYLSSKSGGQQIRASRFVTTSGDESRIQPANGLLKTIENQQQRSNLPAADYFDAYSGISSDKSTTDDSGAPLSSNLPSSFGTKRTFGPRSQARRSQVADLETATQNIIFEAHQQQQQQQHDELLASADLVPMSAEEQWPEPYVEPDDREADGQRQDLRLQASSSGERHSFVQFEPAVLVAAVADNDQDFNLQNRRSQANTSAKRQHHNHHNHNHHQSLQQQQQQPLAYDDAYLYNWHATSRNPRRQSQCIRLTKNDPASIMGSEQAMHSSLMRYRSNPSLQQNFLPLTQPAVGANNWLRWTPSSFVGQSSGTQARHQQQQHEQQQRTEDNGWHNENHIESILVASKLR